MIYESKLYHHGIIGQKWGVQHGPPYPLERGNGKNVGSYKDKDSKNNSKKLTDKQKRAIKIGFMIDEIKEKTEKSLFETSFLMLKNGYLTIKR